MGLNPYNIWFPLLAMMGIVMIAPAVYNWVYPLYQQQPTHVQWLSTFVMPLLVVLVGASWLDSG